MRIYLFPPISHRAHVLPYMSTWRKHQKYITAIRMVSALSIRLDYQLTSAVLSWKKNSNQLPSLFQSCIVGILSIKILRLSRQRDSVSQKKKLAGNLTVLSWEEKSKYSEWLESGKISVRMLHTLMT